VIDPACEEKNIQENQSEKTTPSEGHKIVQKNNSSALQTVSEIFLN
jgi:hypothetical protein